MEDDIFDIEDETGIKRKLLSINDRLSLIDNDFKYVIPILIHIFYNLHRMVL